MDFETPINLTPTDGLEKQAIHPAQDALPGIADLFLFDSHAQLSWLQMQLPTLMMALAQAAAGPSVATPEALGGPGGPYDNLSLQWHLSNPNGFDIHVQPVWDDYTGQGVRVGVVDVGVQYTNPQLSVNYDASSDYDEVRNTNDGSNKFSDEWHATAVSGVIAAIKDGTGTQGVAYDATIVSFRYLSHNGETPVDSVQADTTDVIRLQANVDISNNSWGFTQPFGENSFGADIDSAFQYGVTNGRDGLGTVYVFAAGNSRSTGMDVNYSETDNTRFSIKAAACDINGKLASFSTPGAAVTVTAPGQDIFMLDLTGTAGADSGDFTTQSGTSFSSPCVAGIVALMLQANPNLGYRDVQEILVYSARMIDANRSAHYNASVKSWAYNGAENWNGGGLHFSHDFGAGLVDATAAVRLAETWQGPAHAFSNEVAYSQNSGSINQAINDNSTVDLHMNVASGIQIDHVELQLNMTHTAVGDLVISLISPDGTRSVMFNQPHGFISFSLVDYDSSWSFSSTHHWGETGAGDWTLEIQDKLAGDTGVLNDWTLRLYGDDLSEDNTYIYTNEYGGFTGATNEARRLLHDDSGHDTLNAAAISSNTTLDLTPGNNSTLANNTLTIDNTTVIETVFTGDGNDSITGNTVDNDLYGGRGNDSINGGQGDDHLYGQQGNDLLNGGLGNDHLEGGEGTDSYVFNTGFGNDVIHDTSGNDHLDLTAFQKEDVISWTAIDTNADHHFDQLEIKLTDNDIITIDQYFDNSTNDLGSLGAGSGNIESIAFSNSNLSFSDILSLLTAVNDGAVHGSSGDDILNGDESDNIIRAGDGNDIIYGHGGNDFLYGQNGDDQINGQDGNNTLDGGPGNDTYVFNDSFGQNQIQDDSGVDKVDLSTVSQNLTVNLDSGAGHEVSDGTNTIDWDGNVIENIITGSGDDLLIGNGGNNSLAGGAGNDTYQFSNIWGQDIVQDNGPADSLDFHTVTVNLAVHLDGANLVDIFDGTNSVNILGAVNTFLSGTGDDSLTGNSQDNTIQGGAGNDTILGGSGNDALYGNAGDDNLQGQAGNDVYHFENNFGHDTISDNQDNNVLDMSALTSVLTVNLIGGSLNEVITGSNTLNWADTTLIHDFYSGSGNDNINATNGDNLVDGGGGNDLIHGLSGNDNLYGNSGDDNLFGDSGNDALFGGDGNDILNGGSGINTLHGGAGNDQIFLAGTTDQAFGDDGNDTLTGGNGKDMIDGGAANDSLLGSGGDDKLYGQDGSDTLIGGTGNDRLEGGDGDDYYRFSGHFGIDTLRDTSGSDMLDFSKYTGSLTINLYAANNSNEIDISTDKLKWINNAVEGATSGSGNDKLYGNLSDNFLFGGSGKDTLSGRDGHDWLDGGDGNDTLTGGTGNDTLLGGTGSDRYQSFTGVFGHDVIDDFSGSADILDLSSYKLSAVQSFEALDANNDGKVDGVMLHIGVNDIAIEHYFDNTNALADASHAGAGCMESIKFADITLHFADIQHLL